jgi:sec-independent protein translocase protein TatA
LRTGSARVFVFHRLFVLRLAPDGLLVEGPRRRDGAHALASDCADFFFPVKGRLPTAHSSGTVNIVPQPAIPRSATIEAAIGQEIPMGTLRLPEILFIVVLIVLLFGGRKIPELAKGLGEGIKNFKNALKEGKTEEKKEA